MSPGSLMSPRASRVCAVRTASTPAAVVITNDPLTEYLPIQRKPESGKPIEEAPVVTQYEMHGVEDLGLLKMDFLGLRNLDVISDCLELVKDTKGAELDIDAIELDDQPTFELLKRGETIGVFRSILAHAGADPLAFPRLVRRCRRPGRPLSAWPDGGEHAQRLRRPQERAKAGGVHPPRRRGAARRHLRPDDLSGERHANGAEVRGLLTRRGGLLRKAMGKKIREAMEKEREKFTTGVVEQGYDHSLAVEMFDIIAQFADYAFNKSHSYGYGYVAYQIAYLKANHPVEYLSALLTSVKSKLESAAVYLNECRLMGIDVEVPDINRSEMDFTQCPTPTGTVAPTPRE